VRENERIYQEMMLRKKKEKEKKIFLQQGVVSNICEKIKKKINLRKYVLQDVFL